MDLPGSQQSAAATVSNVVLQTLDAIAVSGEMMPVVAKHLQKITDELPKAMVVQSQVHELEGAPVSEATFDFLGKLTPMFSLARHVQDFVEHSHGPRLQSFLISVLVSHAKAVLHTGVATARFSGSLAQCRGGFV